MTAMTNPGIIDHAPSAGELRKGYGKKALPGSLYFAPAHYSEGGRPEQSPDDNLAGILRHMGNELNFGSPEKFPDTIENAYSVARSIGDSIIGGESPDARALLDGTRAFNMSGRVVNEGLASVHSEGETDSYRKPILEANMDNYFGRSEERGKIEANFKTLGVEVRPEDLSLIYFLKHISHEAGHLVQFGAGHIIDKTHSGTKNAYDHVSSITLKLHPEVAMTPNHHTSARIHSERFAEGYSNIVMQEAVRALGYSDEQKAKILRALGYLDQKSDALGALNEVTSDKTLSDVGKEKGLNFYDGELGYSMPLSLDQVVADLDIINHFMKGEDLDDNGFVERYRGTTVEGPKEMAKELAPVKKSRIKRFGGSIMRRIGRVRWGHKKTAA